jgi:hypothetical protein
MNRIDFSQFDLQGITLQDFEFIQAAYKDALKGLSSGFAPNYVLSGCDFTISGSAPTDVDCTEGYIVIDGEVVKVDAFSVTIPTIFDLKWKIIETPTLPTPALFGDSSLRDVHFKRRAIIDATGTLSAFSVFRQKELIYQIANEPISPESIGLIPEWEPGSTPTVNPAFKIDGHICHLIGDFAYKATSPPTPTIPYLALLPPKAQPITTIMRQTMCCDWDAINNVPINIGTTWVIVHTDGRIRAPHNTGKTIMLNFSYPVN